jgi:hypothetical protein
VAVRSIHVLPGILLLVLAGCGHPTPPPLKVQPATGTPQGETDTNQAIQSALTRIINEATIHYIPLEYQYDEDLLQQLDLIENRLSGKAKAATTRLLPKLDEAEELDHFRETVRRWEAATGKKLRASLDPLKAEVAARKPGTRYYPEFHKKFGAEFDDFIKIEVLEMRERRNREIHGKAKAIFDKYRAAHPEIVAEYQKMIDAPPYNLEPDSSRVTAPPASSGRPKS